MGDKGLLLLCRHLGFYPAYQTRFKRQGRAQFVKSPLFSLGLPQDRSPEHTPQNGSPQIGAWRGSRFNKESSRKHGVCSIFARRIAARYPTSALKGSKYRFDNNMSAKVRMKEPLQGPGISTYSLLLQGPVTLSVLGSPVKSPLPQRHPVEIRSHNDLCLASDNTDESNVASRGRSSPNTQSFP